MNEEQTTHTFDASREPLGRLAAQIALVLRGKESPGFAPHKSEGSRVVVINASRVLLTGKKAQKKQYYRHSGYPGGLRTVPVEDLLQKRPAEVIRRAVSGMLPKNRLRDVFLKRLEIRE